MLPASERLTVSRERVQEMPTSYVIGGGKGGVGKSTLAINLAIFLAAEGKNVAVVDCDTRQRTSAKFFERTERYSIPCETIEKDLLRTLSEADRGLADEHYSNFDAVVFDAPGDIDISKPLFRIADVVVLPSPPQFPDVEELAEAALVVAAIRAARNGTHPEALVVLTKGVPRTNVAKEAMQELEVVQRELRIPVSLNQVDHSIKFSEAYSAYVAVADLKAAPDKPKTQIAQVVKEIARYGTRAEEARYSGEQADRLRSEAGESEGSGESGHVSRPELKAAGNE